MFSLVKEKKDIQDLVKKYKQRLTREIEGKLEVAPDFKSREYHEFRKDMVPSHLSIYEKACKISEKTLKIAPDKKLAPKLEKAIETCHLNITPTGATSLAILAPIVVILAGMFISMVLPMLLQADIGMFGILFFMVLGASLYGILNKLPFMMASSWRLKASNEMVLSVFYIVTYMRHTSNIENALVFASEHLTGPLSLDLRKVIWDVETERYETVKESLDNYLESWRDWNNEYVEAMHLIESSLYESSEDRRLSLLDKSLDVILEETYEKMLHYAHNLHGPITMLHMLGVILPILGLVILPLMASFMTSESLPPNELAIYIAVMYNIALPLIVYYFGKNILASRPTGYGDTNIGERKEYSKYKYIIVKFGNTEYRMSPLVMTVIIGILGLLLTFMPLIMHASTDQDIVITKNVRGNKVVTALSIHAENYKNAIYQFLGYHETEAGQLIGPYGLGAAIFSLFLPLTIGLSIGYYYSRRSKKLVKIRESTKKLEDEFASSLFQLGNRLGDGLPAEIAFSKVADVERRSTTGNFFNIVASNIRRLGMSVKQAIFDKKIGALTYYPSNLIESSMKVLVESSRKGPRIAAQALLNISRYVKEIHRVNERLKDLMADIISSMKSQISFLTPVISGIVIGITSMVTYILSRLKYKMSSLGGGDTGNALGGMVNIFGDGIPTYYTQMIVGLYVIQITYLLTVISNSIENGNDKLNEEYMLGKNLMKSTLLYVFISLAVMLVFNLIAGSIIESMM